MTLILQRITTTTSDGNPNEYGQPRRRLTYVDDITGLSMTLLEALRPEEEVELLANGEHSEERTFDNDVLTVVETWSLPTASLSVEAGHESGRTQG